MCIEMRTKIAKSLFVKGLVGSLCFILIVPPALFAQSLGGATGSSFGALPGTTTQASGQAIVTNPTALQPIAPSQAPCPVPGSSMTQPVPPSPQIPPGGGQAPLPGGMVQPGSGLAQGGISGAPQGFQPGSLGPQIGSQGVQGVQGSPFGVPGGMARGSAKGQAPIPTHPGLLSPFIQQQVAEGTQQQPQPEGVGQLSIEEGFSQFFILQGVTGQLKQFGYNFFDVQFSGFPPVMDTPVGPDYVLGPDDTLALHIWNVPDPNFNRSYIAPIERDGTIFIPQVGSIPVAGATFSQATRLIRAQLGGLLKRFEMHLGMARLRTIKVYVVGEVVRPGAYEVSSLATVSHALYGACGPSKSGSLRKIQVVRGGKPVAELDFYLFFINGDRTQDVRLQSGDTILVPPIGPVVAIGGPVKRPAIYELSDHTTFTKLVDLAGGLMPTADRKRAQIFRIKAGQERVILDIDVGIVLEKGQDAGMAEFSKKEGSPLRRDGKTVLSIDPPIQDGDFVRIASVPTQIENAVSLTGAVRNPGPYEYHPGMYLRDLLTPEQMLVDSYLERAELIRTDPITFETSVIAFSPKKLFQGENEENLRLHRLDKVFVSTQVKAPMIVSVSGEVKRPGQYTVERGERLSSVLKRTGGFRLRAFPKGLILIRESVRQAQQSEIEKFVALQKQKLVLEAASLSAGSVTGPQAGAMSQEQVTLQLQIQALDQLAARLQPGRVVVKLDSLQQLEGSREDIMLEGGDQITVPQQPQTVNIIGAVRNPTTVVHHEALGINDYVQQAGGLTPDAREKELYLLRANGSTEVSYASLREIRAGDTIVVPERVEPKTRPLLLWQSIASIVGSIALTAAGIAVIGR